MAKYEVRVMSEADLGAVELVENQIYEFPWTRQNFQDSIRSGYDAFCMWDDYQLVGYTVMMNAVEHTHLLNISIRGDLQGKGLGRRLLRWCLNFALRHGTEGMLLEVRPSNELARSLYDSEGFKLIGVRKNYYPAVNGREDAMVLCRPFLSPLDA